MQSSVENFSYTGRFEHQTNLGESLNNQLIHIENSATENLNQTTKNLDSYDFSLIDFNINNISDQNDLPSI